MGEDEAKDEILKIAELIARLAAEVAAKTAVTATDWQTLRNLFS